MAYKYNPFLSGLDNVAEYSAFTIKGQVADGTALNALTPSTGDVYQVIAAVAPSTTPYEFFLWDGAAWQNLGTLGTTGPAGATGPTGADGQTILNGSGAPVDNVTGTDGDFYIDTSAHTIYGPRTAGAWGSGTSLVAGGATTLGGLTDVDLTTSPPTNGEALVYDSANSEWVPGAAGATAAGAANQIQYNDGASGLAASADLTWDNTGKELGVGGDLNLDSGGTFSTTVQSVTPTANRTISFPDQTGTVGLVSGATGNIQFNDAGKLAGSGDFNIDLDWNNASTVFTGLKVNVTDTFSAAGSKLLDLQVGGTSSFTVGPNGALAVYNSGFFADSQNLFGVFHVSGGYHLSVSSNTQPFIKVGGPGTGSIQIRNDGGYLGWGASGQAGGTPTLVIIRDADNILAQRNGTNAQTYRLYNTYTDASNYERLSFNWDTNVFKIKSEAAGTGTVRGIELSTTNQNIRLEEAPTEIRSTISNTNFPSWSFERATGNIRGGIAINNSTYDFGTFSNYPVGIRVNNQEKIRVTNEGTLGLSVANTIGSLPVTPTVGMIARVTDGDSGLTFGQTVVNTGAGSTPYLCWYNGTNWTVIGV